MGHSCSRPTYGFIRPVIASDEKVVKELYGIDDVAYVRFASVYRSFKDVNEFMTELKDILKDKEDK